ncbi:MAG TPA: hypothetical protein VJ377_01610 [Dehalococcoidales bacterium]|nr:MAG: hypothetical protein A2Z05_06850 [Chloroflexi bacterium RBG_16_60_22]HJX12203.1 hypothetical protein [Dehalococcoidales bacterium]
MAKKVKVRILGSNVVREVTLEEAREILEDTYNDPVGGFIADARTGEVITQLNPDVEEIVVIEQMIGGG